MGFRAGPESGENGCSQQNSLHQGIQDVPASDVLEPSAYKALENLGNEIEPSDIPLDNPEKTRTHR
jgi:hypothetical protein